MLDELRERLTRKEGNWSLGLTAGSFVVVFQVVDEELKHFKTLVQHCCLFDLVAQEGHLDQKLENLGLVGEPLYEKLTPRTFRLLFDC